MIRYHVSSARVPVDNVTTPLVAVVAGITSPRSTNPSVEEVVDFCHWILPTDAVAKVKVVLDPEQMVALLAVITLATANGLTVTETTFEGEVQAPLVATARYQVVGVNAAYTKLPVANVELVTVADRGTNVHTGVALVAFTKLVDLYQAIVPVESPKVRIVPDPVQTESDAVVNSKSAKAVVTVTLTAAVVAVEQAPLENTILYQVF